MLRFTLERRVSQWRWEPVTHEVHWRPLLEHIGRGEHRVLDNYHGLATRVNRWTDARELSNWASQNKMRSQRRST